MVRVPCRGVTFSSKLGNFESLPGDSSVKSLCFTNMDFCIQLVGVFTFRAITFEIIQYIMWSGIDDKTWCVS